MATILAKEVKNIRIEKRIIKDRYSSINSYSINGEPFEEKEVYELYKDIEDLLSLSYIEDRQNDE